MDVRIKQSKTGLGVFAKREFLENEIVGIASGEIIIDQNYSSDYCVELDETVSLEPGPPFRFLNHCCQPNAELVSEDIDEMGRIPDLYVMAISDIEPGEEILIDYCWPADYAVPCKCHSPNCRGWIVSDEELHLVEREY